MCGIAGIVGYGEAAPAVEQGELLRLRDAMERRGPDGAGLWLSQDRRAGFGHRRLAIIDLSDTGAQPMHSADGRYVIVFNGEIYNYQALTRELKAAGVAFRSSSDTEVLLHLYARHGAAMLGKLRGMYAFSIWDTVERRLFLARDPFGIKPLYYADDGRTLRFASQVRALAGVVKTTPDPSGRAGFLLWGSVPEPFTLHREIRALPAGSWKTVDAKGGSAPTRHFDIAAEYRKAEEAASSFDRERWFRRLGGTLADSVAQHMVADVPVGVFLSAGIDSSAVATLAARAQGAELRCVTLGFEEFRGGASDETVLAARTARALRARHEVDWIGRQAFYDEIPDVMAAMDQPSIDGINTYFVARAAARQGLKVALSGLGGDELFLGYPSFDDVPRMVGALGFTSGMPGWSRRALRALLAPVISPFASPKYAGLPEYGGSYEGAYLLRRGLFMPWELARIMGPEAARAGLEGLQTIDALARSREGVRSEAGIVSALELSWYMRGQLLRDADWAGMAHSVEIRVPFVDTEVLRAAAPLVAAGAVYSKREVALLPELGLPREVIDRPKSGFLVPVREWLDAFSRSGGGERRLRGWGRRIDAQFAGARSMLVLVTDAFGSIGGIAQFNRELLSALCANPEIASVTALPRNGRDAPQDAPAGLQYDLEAAGSKSQFVIRMLHTLWQKPRCDLVVCGHINLVPLAYFASRMARAPLLLVIHGIDAWTPPRRTLVNLLCKRVDAVVSVSRFTLERFQRWSGVPDSRCAILPNAVRLEQFGAGARDETLAARYGLDGKQVIMTLARLEESERMKGVDEVMELMASSKGLDANLRYLVAGEGSDRPRLEVKARRLGLEGRVVFAGALKEDEKAEHYRLADAYVMPSRGEGFGIVFLEAMACGIPVVASKTDGGREAVLDGELGELVDPANRDELESVILESISRPKRVPQGLEYFSTGNFERRVRRILTRSLLLNG